MPHNMTFFCQTCPEGSSEYGSLVELQTHIREVHSAGRRQEFAINPEIVKKAEEVRVAGGTVAPNSPTPEQPSLPVSPPVELPPVERKAEPIILTYVYLGDCPVCFNKVDTLELQVEDVILQVAYCTPCKKKISYQKVIPIAEQWKTKKT